MKWWEDAGTFLRVVAGLLFMALLFVQCLKDAA